MTLSHRVVYAVSLSVPESRSDELGAWLPNHIDEMLALPGFIEAHRFETEPTGDGRVVHRVHYILGDRAALDHYLETDAERMRAPGIARFGEDLRSSRDIREFETRSEPDATKCLNCQVDISGQYCWNCGQRANTRLISLFELVRDAFGDMFELDSRLWRTLLPLMTKPGFLTDEYLRGRRARYMPPFRMYLVLSFLFFLLTTAFGADSSAIQIQNEPPNPIDGIEIDGNGVRMRIGEDEQAPAGTSQDETTTDDSGDLRDAITEEDAEFYCNIDFSEIGMSWLDSVVTQERAEAICKHIEQDRGQRIQERFIQNLPVGALALLPLLALLLKFLYPLSKRYYVEHLLALVHYHSFLFFSGSLLITFNQLMTLINAGTLAFVLQNTALGIYMPVYLYKTLRRVYRQGRLATLFKFLLLFAGYLTAIVTIIVSMLIYILVTY